MSTYLLALFALFVAALSLFRAFGDHMFQARRIKKLRQRTLELERSLRQRSTLANEVAHDIKNPLTAILCSAETLDLLIGDKIDPEHRKSLRYIREYGDQMLRLVSDFIDISRAEAGHLEAYPEPIKLGPIFETIIGLLQSNAINKQISLSSCILEPGLEAKVDPKHLKQIIFNLVHNAIKFTPAGGLVQILAKSDFPSPWVRITVRDNGPGIEADELAFVFDPYARGERGLREGDAGTGLGLALVKSLIELNGGTITVSSTPGIGTAFECMIPLGPSSTLVGHEATSEIVADTQPLLGQTFLIVDQDLSSRESVAKLIEALGGAADRVSLAADAVSALSSREYDAVMIDDAVDGVYGCELAKLIREEVPADKTTIIVTTRGKAHEDAVIEAGADKVIQKPLNGKALVKSLAASGKYALTH